MTERVGIERLVVRHRDVGFDDPADCGVVVAGGLVGTGSVQQCLQVGFEGDEFGDLGPDLVEALAEDRLDMAAGLFAAVVEQ